ncbi:hypothetical protein FB466_2223 [Klugiella xanthotipulae]|uniref:Uncharacterized protein n=1 Tax=Klugiella xanthotipulae TaxID=244735 RepID=A0A543HSN3_9MICO|nr:hypothetical protein FB466_2223 [Klugiella xanthotipulae]
MHEHPDSATRLAVLGLTATAAETTEKRNGIIIILKTSIIYSWPVMSFSCTPSDFVSFKSS